ncbi:MAG TPA: hypothetical protein VL523_11710 [Terriglobia bacterium]|nr:hypothetical protein [Terriglobia bacterium]
MLRLSDTVNECHTPSSCSGSNYANGNVQSSSDLNPFSVPNADAHGTYDICTRTDGNTIVIFNFDSVTFTSQRIDAAAGSPGQTGANVPSDGDGSCEMSHLTARTLYATKAGGSTSAPLMEKFAYSYSGTPPITWSAPVQRLDPNMCYFDTQGGHAGQGAFLPAVNGPPGNTWTITPSTAAGSWPSGTSYVDIVYYEPTPYVNPVTSATGTAVIETTPAHEQSFSLGGTGEFTVSGVPAPTTDSSKAAGYRVYAGVNSGYVALQAEVPVSNWASVPSVTISAAPIMYYNGTLGGMIGQNCRSNGGSPPNWGDAGTSTGCAIAGRDLSADDTRQVISIGGTAQDSQYAEIVYDSTKDQGDGVHPGCRWYNTLLGETGGDWGPGGTATNQLQAVTSWNGGTGLTLPASSHLALNPTTGNAYGYYDHGLNISKSGLLAEVEPTGDAAIPYNSLGNIEAGESPPPPIAEMTWQIDTSSVTAEAGQTNCPADNTGISCNFGGHLSMGWNDQADTGGQGGYQYRYHVYDTTAVRGANSDNGCVPPTYCASNKIVMNPNYALSTASSGQHSAFQQFSSGSIAPVLESFDNESNTPFAGPWQGEVVGWETVGCATGSCTGIGHRFAVNYGLGDNIAGFNNSARGAGSQDGKYFIFASAWTGNQSVNGGIVAPGMPTSGVTSGGTLNGTYYVAVTYVTPTVAASGGVAEYGGETQTSSYATVTPSTQAVTVNYPATTGPKNATCNCNQATSWNVYMSTDHATWYLQTTVSGFGSGVGATITSYSTAGAHPPTVNTTGSRPTTPLGTTTNGTADTKCQILPSGAQPICRDDAWLVKTE